MLDFSRDVAEGGYFPDFTLILKNRQLTKVRFTILLLSGPVRIKPGEKRTAS